MGGSTYGQGWRRSSRCGTQACVEVARRDESVLLRDSKDPNGPQLEFDFPAWEDFVNGIKDAAYGSSPGSS